MIKNDWKIFKYKIYYKKMHKKFIKFIKCFLKYS